MTGTVSGLRIGTAGIPLSAQPRTSEGGLKRLAELGLSCMELEFVRSVQMGADTAEWVRLLGSWTSASPSIPYYVNPNSAEPEKSRPAKRTSGCRIGAAAGARSVVFAFTMPMTQSRITGCGTVSGRCAGFLWRGSSASVQKPPALLRSLAPEEIVRLSRDSCEMRILPPLPEHRPVQYI